MQFTFDLISDLHVETWRTFDWSNQATSPYCVVAGDVAKDHTVLKDVLTQLGKCYRAVFYIDGNDEHDLTRLGDSYKELNSAIRKIPNVIYMQDNVVIIDGVALLATNGWWSYDLDPDLEMDQCHAWHADRMNISMLNTASINSMAYNDAAYVINSVKKLQTYRDVKAIVIITHTVPAKQLIDHDIELVNTWRFNAMGNGHMEMALDGDTEHKVKAWCFGHYHKSVDREFDGVRYVNNCRGRNGTDWCQVAYYPKRITIEI